MKLHNSKLDMNKRLKYFALRVQFFLQINFVVAAAVISLDLRRGKRTFILRPLFRNRKRKNKTSGRHE